MAGHFNFFLLILFIILFHWTIIDLIRNFQIVKKQSGIYYIMSIPVHILEMSNFERDGGGKQIDFNIFLKKLNRSNDENSNQWATFNLEKRKEKFNSNNAPQLKFVSFPFSNLFQWIIIDLIPNFQIIKKTIRKYYVMSLFLKKFH